MRFYVNRTLLRAVLQAFDVPPTMLAEIRRFHDGMRACAQSGCASTSPFKGCLLAPMLLNTCWKAVLNVALAHFRLDADDMAGMCTLLRAVRGWGPEGV